MKIDHPLKACAMALVIVFASLALPRPTMAIDNDHYVLAQQSIDRGIAYLRSTQNADGSWTPEPGPAVTALAISAMLDQPDIGPDDPQVARGLDYILSKVQPDGGIYDGILPNYNTSICLSALSRIKDRPDVAKAIADGQAFLKSIQWQGQEGPDGQATDAGHPFHGGFGYGKHGRPDGSNTQFAVQALYDMGLDCEDPAFQRAAAFMNRLQGHESNELLGDKIVQDGGAIYATSLGKDHVGVPESKASPQMIDEGKAGRPVSGLRTYGSMTYAMFKSYVYAQLRRDDPRVLAALDWIQNNYTLDRNPGMPEGMHLQGHYYYLLTFGRALRAWGTSHVATANGERDWGNDLVDQLVPMQREDGSWINEADRWMEGDPNLVTSYALLALIAAQR